jgi:hypothetical protein
MSQPEKYDLVALGSGESGQVHRLVTGFAKEALSGR